jgi:hypothetical protein
MNKVAMLMLLGLLLLPVDTHANRLSHFLGTWTGSRTYDLPELKGTETFTMRVETFQKTGLKVESLINRPGWDQVYSLEVFYPGGDQIGPSGKQGTSGDWIAYDFRSGRWRVSGKRLTWNWFMYFAQLGERAKNTTTWSIDSKGMLQEVRTTGGGKITATATKVP